MLRNLDATHGLVFSGQLLQDLVEHGAPREDAYKWVQGHAMAAWESETSFKERIAADANIRKFLDEKALAHTFDLQRQLRAVDAIFQRVFGAKPPPRAKLIRGTNPPQRRRVRREKTVVRLGAVAPRAAPTRNFL